jgi:5-methylcytosine-specific restriction endonuclease McrA
LAPVGVARAVCLWFRGAVYVEENDGDNVLHSPSTIFPVPSVIRLRHYIHVRRNRPETTMKRARVYIRDRYRCQYCGEHRHAKDLTLDHILPRAQGGESTPANLVTACVKCNQRKGNRTPEQARMPLLTSQKLLRLGLDHVLLCHYANRVRHGRNISSWTRKQNRFPKQHSRNRLRKRAARTSNLNLFSFFTAAFEAACFVFMLE